MAFTLGDFDVDYTQTGITLTTVLTIEFTPWIQSVCWILFDSESLTAADLHCVD